MPEKLYTVAEAKRILGEAEFVHTAATCFAAHTHMETYEYNPDATFDDMLGYLDFHGKIATVGETCL